MKKWLVRILGAVLSLVLLAVGALVVKFYGLSPKSRPAPDVKAPTTPEAISRGKYLVDNVAACLGCHSKVDEGAPGEPIVSGMAGSGRDFGPVKGLGHMRAPNLSSDKRFGIGAFTDGEVLRAMREGIGKDGRALFPQMPYQTYAETLSDDDALAIIAYLRTLPPVAADPGRFELDFPVSMFIRAAPKPVESPIKSAPAPSDKLARGRWLLKAGSCNDCHDTVDGHHAKIPGKALAGGQSFPLPGGKGVAMASNITSDPATGIGAYSDEDLRRVFDEGKNKAGRFLYVMPWRYYGGMTREDKDALIAALREVPAVPNLVPASTVP